MLFGLFARAPLPLPRIRLSIIQASLGNVKRKQNQIIVNGNTWKTITE